MPSIDEVLDSFKQATLPLRVFPKSPGHVSVAGTVGAQAGASPTGQGNEPPRTAKRSLSRDFGKALILVLFKVEK